MAGNPQPDHAALMAAFEAGQKATNKRLNAMAKVQAANAKKLDAVVAQQETDSATIKVAAEWINTIGGLQTGGKFLGDLSKWGAVIMGAMTIITAGLIYMKDGVKALFGGGG